MTDNEKYVSSTGLKQVLQGVKTYINEQDELRDVDTNLVNSQLQEEVVRAKAAELQLQNDIRSEVDVRTAQVSALHIRIEDESKTRYQQLNDKIAAVTKDYQDHVKINRKEIEADTKDMETAIYVRITDESRIAAAAVNNERDRAIIKENALTDSLNIAINNHIALEQAFDAHSKDRNDLAVSAQNPHGITTDKIGAATKDEHHALVDRVAVLETTTTDHEERLAQEELVTNNHEERIFELENMTLKSEGEQELNGTLRVTGNLVVDGKTTTVEHETLSVADYQLIINSDGEELGNAKSGIAIRTSTEDAYGIVYDQLNDSVSLCKGTIADNKFEFSAGEAKPILTRDVSANIEDKHLLIWDASRKIAIDGGLYDEDKLKDTFTTWTAHHALAHEVRMNDEDIAALQAEDVIIHGRIDTAEAAIEKNREHIELVEEQLNTHESNQSNPHSVNWDQIKSNALSIVSPVMDGTATVGTSERVAREDHKHPTDTSRAPVYHASTTTDFGVGTTSLYGHVIVDNVMSDTSTNTVQNKVIKDYIDSLRASIDVAGDTALASSETYKTVTESGGIITFEKQAINISVDQVAELSTTLTELREDIDTNTENIETLDKTVSDLQKDLEEEKGNRADGDAVVKKELTDYVDDKLDNIMLQVTDAGTMLSDELTFTRPFGRYTVPAAGSYKVGKKPDGSLMSLRELFLDAFCDETVGSITTPSCSFYLLGGTDTINMGEVGTTFSAPSVRFQVDSVGTYQYGPETGITYSAVLSDGTNTFTDTSLGLNETLDSDASKLTGGTYSDTTTTTYTFTLNYEYSAATNAPNTNLNNVDADQQLSGATNMSDSISVRYVGYRKHFMGAMANTIDYTASGASANIRSLPTSAQYSDGTYEVTASASDTQIVWAFPANEQSTATFKYDLFNKWETLKGVTGPITVSVADASGTNNKIDYNVYVYYAPDGTFGATMKTQVIVS